MCNSFLNSSDNNMTSLDLHPFGDHFIHYKNKFKIIKDPTMLYPGAYIKTLNRQKKENKLWGGRGGGTSLK